MPRRCSPAASSTLRPLTQADLDTLIALFADPTVLRWWGHYDRDRVMNDVLGDHETSGFAVEVAGQFAGMIQFGEELDPMYHHASIDIALSEPFQGRGAVPDAIRAVARHLISERGHHRVTIDPRQRTPTQSRRTNASALGR